MNWDNYKRDLNDFYGAIFEGIPVLVSLMLLVFGLIYWLSSCGHPSSPPPPQPTIICVLGTADNCPGLWACHDNEKQYCMRMEP